MDEPFGFLAAKRSSQLGLIRKTKSVIRERWVGAEGGGGGLRGGGGGGVEGGGEAGGERVTGFN